MTAEIAILNKSAIALAADSAVSIGNGDKIYNSANKIFTLSKYQPVGIMIYSSAEFMGVPWETIIKEFRKVLGEKNFPHLTDYYYRFLNFLTSKDLNLEVYEPMYVTQLMSFIIELIQNDISARYTATIDSSGGTKLSDNELKALIDDVIENFGKKLEALDDSYNLPADYQEYINTKYEIIAMKMVEELLPDNTKDDIKLKLTEYILKVLQKDILGNVYSGIVVVGFGESELFPSIISCEISGSINNYLKLIKKEEFQVTLEHDYSIFPFAQRDSVDSFLMGISPSYINVIDEAFKQLILPSCDSIPDIGIRDAIHKEVSSKWSEVLDSITKYSSDNYIQPIVKAIRISPKEELASMAAALVNLTSFKRQVSIDEHSRTVGGPIDVAVISKGDGFIWIERKHYFDPNLNHHFFDNYYYNKKGG